LPPEPMLPPPPESPARVIFFFFCCKRGHCNQRARAWLRGGAGPHEARHRRGSSLLGRCAGKLTGPGCCCALGQCDLQPHQPSNDGRHRRRRCSPPTAGRVGIVGHFRPVRLGRSQSMVPGFWAYNAQYHQLPSMPSTSAVAGGARFTRCKAEATKVRGSGCWCSSICPCMSTNNQRGMPRCVLALKLIASPAPFIICRFTPLSVDMRTEDLAQIGNANSPLLQVADLTW